MSISRFEQVLLEESLRPTPRHTYRTSFTAKMADAPSQTFASVGQSYGEFWEQLDGVDAAVQYWEQLRTQLSSLTRDDLKVLRSWQPSTFILTGQCNRKNAAELLAIINADIDHRLKSLGS